MLELFAGRGGVGRAVAKRGVRVAAWELAEDPSLDVAAPENLRRIKRDMFAGRVVCVMLAPPCSSWSALRQLHHPLRSSAQPWGLATPGMTGK